MEEARIHRNCSAMTWGDSYHEISDDHECSVCIPGSVDKFTTASARATFPIWLLTAKEVYPTSFLRNEFFRRKQFELTFVPFQYFSFPFLLFGWSFGMRSPLE
jgi:hypothetical protein